MKILFVNDYHVPQLYRGTEVNTHAMCQMLRHMGHDVSVICALKADGLLGFWSRVKLKAPPRPQWVTDQAAGYRTYRTWHVARVLADVVRSAAPDVVVLQTGSEEVLEAAAKLSVPICLYFHFVPEQPAIPAFQQVTYMTNSLFCQRRVIENFGIESTIVRPLVIPAHYRTAVDRAEVTAFAMTHIKGADIVLDLAKALPQVPFRIFANQGSRMPVNDILFDRAKALPNVTLSAPQRSGGQVYARTRVVLAPSRWEETWGRMATEAHVNDIPVLASNRGGLPESVGRGGLCLPVDAPIEVWRDALQTMFEDATAYARYQEEVRAQRSSPLIDPDAICGTFMAELEALLRR
jgi:glycosyltransferase involved in cell wall biosynthesis